MQRDAAVLIGGGYSLSFPFFAPQSKKTIRYGLVGLRMVSVVYDNYV